MPEAPLPPGFHIRPLAGAGEIDAYVALHQAVFQSKSMNSEWRQRTLQRAEYEPDLDLVVEAPNGQLAAFCIGWLDRSRAYGKPAGQIEPMGVHADFTNTDWAKRFWPKICGAFSNLTPSK